jgi:hypothetical protein
MHSLHWLCLYAASLSNMLLSTIIQILSLPCVIYGRLRFYARVSEVKGHQHHRKSVTNALQARCLAAHPPVRL